MTKDAIYVQYPTADSSQSVRAAAITKSVVNASNGVSVKNAFANKNNSLLVCVENNGESDSYLTFCAGNAYPNAMLGDLQQALASGTTTVFQIQDPSRFENKDGSLDIDFAAAFDGKIFVIAKSTALNA